MNDDVTLALKILAWIGGISALVWLGSVFVRAARRGGGGMRGIGAALMLGGWATMRDPRNNTVAEAQDGRIRKGTSTGDPLDREPPEN